SVFWCILALIRRSWYVVVFFFQAEDGIRDRNVTGVQTCALPICTTSNLQATATEEALRPRDIEWRCDDNGNIPEGKLDLLMSIRSEERRVGKECRSRWWR